MLYSLVCHATLRALCPHSTTCLLACHATPGARQLSPAPSPHHIIHRAPSHTVDKKMGQHHTFHGLKSAAYLYHVVDQKMVPTSYVVTKSCRGPLPCSITVSMRTPLWNHQVPCANSHCNLKSKATQYSRQALFAMDLLECCQPNVDKCISGFPRPKLSHKPNKPSQARRSL